MIMSSAIVTTAALTTKTYLSGRLFGAFVIYVIPTVSKKIKRITRKRVTSEVK